MNKNFTFGPGLRHLKFIGVPFYELLFQEVEVCRACGAEFGHTGSPAFCDCLRFQQQQWRIRSERAGYTHPLSLATR